VTTSTKSNSSLRKKKRAVICLGNLLTKLANDLGLDPADKRYALKRLQQEGIPFVTKILPLFSAYTLRCVEAGKILSTKSELTNFRWKGKSPSFMLGFLEKAVNGCAVSLRIIRQFCDFFYKTAFSFTKEDLEKARLKYVKTDNSLPEINDWGRVERMRKLLHTVFPRFSSATTADILQDSRPRFGPGAFFGSEHITGPGKFVNPEHFKRSDATIVGTCDNKHVPYQGYFRAYPASREPIKVLNNQDTAEILFVPKDSRGPRTISKEPIYSLKMQLSFNDYASHMLTTESNGRINFADQTVNQRIAKESSKDRKYATLDLKDASDRVQYVLTSALFRYTNGLKEFCSRFRTTHVNLGENMKIKLRKFANMGSGLCFPVLALVVYLSAVDSILQHRYPTSRWKPAIIKMVTDQVYVYGDDLCVPTCFFACVKEGLEILGLAVNNSKSYVNGYFRESCGADYYHGLDVAPIRFRLSNAGLGPTSIYRNGYLPLQEVKKDGSFGTSTNAILQTERLCRQLIEGGLFQTAEYLYRIIERETGELPNVSLESPALGRYNPYSGYLGYSTKENDLDVFESIRNPKYYKQATTKVLVPLTDQVFISDGLCPYKGMASRLVPADVGTDVDTSLVDDSNAFYRVPLRGRITFKRTVLGNPELGMEGLSKVPSHWLRSIHRGNTSQIH
jgi:hypothetical protein